MTKRARTLRPLSAGGGSAATTFGPATLASDWILGENTAFSTSPGTTANVGSAAAPPGGDGYYAYGMRWTSVSVAKDATISSAKVKIRLTSSDASAVAYSAYAAADDAGVPGDQSAAITQLNICTRTRWSSDIFDGSGGSSGELEIDVKDHIEAVTSRSGWSSGNALVIYLAGAVTADGMGGCTSSASGDDFVAVATDQHSTSSYHPTLEIVHS